MPDASGAARVSSVVRPGTPPDEQSPIPSPYWNAGILVSGILVLFQLEYLASEWVATIRKTYAARTPPKGTKFTVNGLIGNQKYSGNLVVHVSEDGFFLSATLPVAFGHEALFIPWSAVHNRRPKDSRWRATVEFEIGCPCITRMELPRKIFQNWYRS